jgi:acyl-coenzyme A thioesterase PaaI-like protein
MSERSGVVTIDLQASFLRPASPGRITGRGRALHRESDVAFVEATLYDTNDEAVAAGSATARVIQLSG